MNRKAALLIVNSLTFGRVPLVVLFMIGALIQSHAPQPWLPVASLAALILASATDWFDGLLARRWHVVTPFGAMADPLMDKVFYLVVFPTLLYLLGRAGPEEARHALLMLFFVVLYILRDQWVTFLRSLGALYQADVRANWMGKLRTAISFPIGCLIYLYVAMNPAWLPRSLLYGVEIFAIALNLVSIQVYTRQYAPHIRRALSGPSAGGHGP